MKASSVSDSNLGRVVQGAGSYTSRQGSVYAPGISVETVGARAVFLGMVTLPPEGRTKAPLFPQLDGLVP